MTVDSSPRADLARCRSGWRTTWGLAWRQRDYWATVYRRTWKGSVVSSFLLPVLYLAAMGVGLGSFIDSPGAHQRLGGVSYLAFVAPGLLAATAMQSAIGASAYPVLSNFKWNKVYLSMTSTPLTVTSVLLAHVCYVGLRLLVTSGVFLVVLAVSGLVSGAAAGLLAWPVAVVTGLAHATPVFAYAATLNHDAGFAALFRLGVVPMFLFSGAFFPVSQLPQVFEWAAQVTPLFHGVELARMLLLGDLSAGPGVLHLAYVLVWLALGWRLAVHTFTRRLVV